ncbi:MULTISPECIES: alkaline shock response membrane anchor protein AmaP [Exiguobacterium]|uniref:alkaline shock response membrane anchor protein AmaP n=1 Tax=Exiguobacterium TaxID=33986 RepID=UPI0004940C42|nr:MULTISPECIES: alkaline shock response membrane anchor protein AmaP [Exiguobacterium]HCD57716.1 alkaline shock response membrane anchor protein AmaP [Exiguobacterium sp.]
MNGFNRFLLVLIGILGLVSVGLLVLGVYDVPRLSPLIEQWQDQQWYSYTILSLGGFLAFVFVILLFTGLFSRSKGQRLLIQTGDGNITISKQTIERTALESIRGINGVRSPRVNADIHSKKETVALEVDCSVFGQEGLPTIGKDIQERAKHAVESLLELPVTKTRVRISDTKTKTSERVV